MLVDLCSANVFFAGHSASLAAASVSSSMTALRCSTDVALLLIQAKGRLQATQHAAVLWLNMLCMMFWPAGTTKQEWHQIKFLSFILLFIIALLLLTNRLPRTA
jgi:hypothetical protein